jgi:hypothetical protein
MLVWSSLVVWGAQANFFKIIKHVNKLCSLERSEGVRGGPKWPIPSYQRLLEWDSVMVIIAAANRIYAKVGVGGHKYKLFRKCWYANIYGRTTQKGF